MSFEEYKRAIFERLLELNSKQKAKYLFELIEKDLKTYYEEKWTPNEVATAIENNFI